VRKALLILFYYTVFAPLAWILRLFHDVLDQAWDSKRVTYFDLTPEPSATRAGRQLQSRICSLAERWRR
jgi:hypothetical protein